MFIKINEMSCKGPGEVLVTSGTALREEVSISKNPKTHTRSAPRLPCSPFTHPTFADVFNLKDNPKFNQFRITNFF